MEPKLLEIYQSEMRMRVERLRAALARAGARDPKSRAESLYDAHLQAHTIKGTSQQLKFEAAAELAAAMTDSLVRARESGELTVAATRPIERACNAMLAWLDNPMGSSRNLTIALATFALDQPSTTRRPLV